MPRRDKRKEARTLDTPELSEDASESSAESTLDTSEASGGSSLIVPPPIVPPPIEPEVTLSVFSRSRPGPIMAAFIQCERLYQTHTRKCTQGQWAAEFDAFVSKPR